MGCKKLTYHTKENLSFLRLAYSSREQKGSRENLETIVEAGLYYYGARYYNPSVSVWLSVDPLASSYPHLTPYNFVEGNPIMLVDPTGMNSSPIFDENGQELGVDSEGYKGDVIIMNRDEYNKRTNNGAETLDHAEAMDNGKVMTKDNVTKEVRQNIVNSVMCEYTLPDGTVVDETNLNVVSTDLHKKQTYHPSAKRGDKNGNIQTVYDYGFNFEYTVENIQGLIGNHEFYGHGILNLTTAKEHLQVFMLTLKYSSPNTTSKFKLDQAYHINKWYRNRGKRTPQGYLDIYYKNGGNEYD